MQRCAMLSGCYILITNNGVFGKRGVTALVLMQETSGAVGPVATGAGVPLQTAGAALLRLAWQHRDLLGVQEPQKG